MSSIVCNRPGVIVVDDFLLPETFAALSEEVEQGEFRSVHARRWDKAWQLCDGNPLRGAAVYFDPSDAFRWEGVKYPTNTPVDAVFDSLRSLARQHPLVVGREGVDWVAAFLAPWLYPVGSSLSLHCDGGAYSGAFTLFTHPRWAVHWGGELLVLDDVASAAIRPSWIAEDDDAGLESPLGIATCVFPRPNRVALLGHNRPHLIRRVDSNAGAHVRASVAGFFLRRP